MYLNHDLDSDLDLYVCPWRRAAAEVTTQRCAAHHNPYLKHLHSPQGEMRNSKFEIAEFFTSQLSNFAFRISNFAFRISLSLVLQNDLYDLGWPLVDKTVSFRCAFERQYMADQFTQRQFREVSDRQLAPPNKRPSRTKRRIKTRHL